MTQQTEEAASDPNTGAGLIEFLDAAIEKGWFNVSTAKALKTASIKILSVESGWESVDLREVDIDSLFDRFRNLRRNDYSDDSMRIYKTRFGQALKMHLARVDGDSDWKSHGPGAKSASPKNGNGGPKVKTKTPSAPKSKSASQSPALNADESHYNPPDRTDSPALMRFPFPLRDNVDASLSLPRDLTKDEAARLGAFLNSLARDA